MKVCLAEFKFSVPISLLIYFRNKWNLEVRNDEQIFLSGLLVFKGLFCSYGNWSASVQLCVGSGIPSLLFLPELWTELFSWKPGWLGLWPHLLSGLGLLRERSVAGEWRRASRAHSLPNSGCSRCAASFGLVPAEVLHRISQGIMWVLRGQDHNLYRCGWVWWVTASPFWIHASCLMLSWMLPFAL